MPSMVAGSVHRGRTAWHWMALLLTMLLACSGPQPPKLPVGPGPELGALPAVASRVLAVSVQSAPDMNQSMALMLDVVFVTQRALLPKLPKTGPEWFRRKQALMLEYGPYLGVMELQMTLSDAAVLHRPEASDSEWQAVLVFANYLAKAGQQRVEISVYECPHLLLMKEGLAVSRGHKQWDFGLLPTEWDRHECVG